MPLSPGTRVGPYEIVALIGAGGMGQVYRAHDARLNRDVAIKVSTSQFTERFDREARAVAALNHPNICTLYDIGPDYLVMEYVEGDAPQGPLALEETLRICRQIADALEAAHEKGITHRDLKPANIKIKPDGSVKVLDFGLAKMPPASAGDSENSPTLSMAATQAGVILGTAAYMSPEQARGKVVDKRADIWAFGVVFYELLTGRRLFQGEDVSHTMAAVIMQEPRFDGVPLPVQRLLKGCLEKDPKKRLRDIGDVWRLMEEPPSAVVPSLSAPSRSRFGVVASALAGVFAIALAAVSYIHFREKAPVPEVLRFQIHEPDKFRFSGGAVISPDGRKVAFPAQGADGAPQLWIHSLDSLESRPVAGTEGVANPVFWSPDSRFIAFGSQDKLKKVAASGGPPQTLCDVAGPWRGGGWVRNENGDGTIVFAAAGKGLFRVPESGGAAQPLTTLDASQQENTHAVPNFLPDGRHFIYQRFSTVAEKDGIFLGSLDNKPDQQGSKRLVATESNAAFAPTPDLDRGYILFVREGSLMAQPFDTRKLEMSGEAVPIAGTEGLNDSNAPRFSASMTGALAYRSGEGGQPRTQLIWFDRTGKILEKVGQPGQYNTVSLSPDGMRAAVSLIDPASRNTDLWVREFARDTSTRLTFDPARDWMATWSPDGTHIVFGSQRGDGNDNFYQKVSSGAGNEDVLLKADGRKYPYDWSQDGKFLLYGVQGVKGLDLWVLPFTGDDRKPALYLETDFNKSQARFSPNGRFVAYTSNASGKNEVYVQPFPTASGGKWQVSQGGGNQPRWKRDGTELYYLSADSKMMAVDVAESPAFKPGVPKALFPAPIWGGATTINVTRYDVTGDGKKFLINTLGAESAPTASSPITVVMNWMAELKK